MSEQKRREPATAPAPQAAKESPVAQKNPTQDPGPRQSYRVLRRVVVDGVAHEEGGVVALTGADAQSLGDAITSILTVPVAEEISKREAGIYEVAGPGGVWATLGDEERARMHGPGTLLELSAAEARDLGTAIRAVA